MVKLRNNYGYNFTDSNKLIVRNEKDIEKIGIQFHKRAVNLIKWNNINRLKRNYELYVVIKSILDPCSFYSRIFSKYVQQIR